MSQRGFSSIIILLLALVIGVVSLVMVSRQPMEKRNPKTITTASPSAMISESSKKWLNYSNLELGVSFEYPEYWIVQLSGKSLSIVPEGDAEPPFITMNVLENLDQLSLKDLSTKLSSVSGLDKKYYSEIFAQLGWKEGGYQGYEGSCTLDGPSLDIQQCDETIYVYRQKVYQFRNVVRSSISGQSEIYKHLQDTLKFSPINFSERSKWKKYKSEKLGVSFAYPPEVVLNENQEQVVLSIYGGSQPLGIDRTDGLSVSIGSAQLPPGKTLHQYIDEQIQLLEHDTENLKINKYPSEITINNKKGITYISSGFSTGESIYFPLDEKRYLIIEKSVADPQQVGYQKIVDDIVNSLEFN